MASATDNNTLEHVTRWSPEKQAAKTMWNMSSNEFVSTAILARDPNERLVPLSDEALDVLKEQLNVCIVDETTSLFFPIHFNGNYYLSPSNAESVFVYLDTHPDVSTVRIDEARTAMDLTTSFGHSIRLYLHFCPASKFFVPDAAIVDEDASFAADADNDDDVNDGANDQIDPADNLGVQHVIPSSPQV